MHKAALLIILQLVTQGADSYFTNRNMHQQFFHEYNPLMRPFTRNTASLALSASAETAGVIYVERRLRMKGHETLADSLAAGNIATHTFGATWSATHAREIKWSTGQ